mmetsp:Transcript_147047/g.259926  ORF Transcript_147047/g.259926 Transcript_147047/m.259926 type:complete len:204 (+) Transcript_147047:454-1065(+)
MSHCSEIKVLHAMFKRKWLQPTFFAITATLVVFEKSQHARFSKIAQRVPSEERIRHTSLPAERGGMTVDLGICKQNLPRASFSKLPSLNVHHHQTSFGDTPCVVSKKVANFIHCALSCYCILIDIACIVVPFNEVTLDILLPKHSLCFASCALQPKDARLQEVDVVSCKLPPFWERLIEAFCKVPRHYISGHFFHNALLFVNL